MSECKSIVQLLPTPSKVVKTKGLYLKHFRDKPNLQVAYTSYVYTNFVASLDGKISITSAKTGNQYIPSTITNKVDWRLYQELAAISDAVIISANFIRNINDNDIQSLIPISISDEYKDLLCWRNEKRLSRQPAVIILSKTLNIPLAKLHKLTKRKVYIATGHKTKNAISHRLKSYGIEIIRAGDGNSVNFKELIPKLADIGLYNIYSVAGPNILYGLLKNQCLDRLYLSQVNKIIAGKYYDPIVTGPLLTHPASFSLQELYYDGEGPSDACQLFYVFNCISPR